MNDGYLQKFNADINRQYLLDFHPEAMIHNYDEISALKFLIESFKKNNYSIEQYYAIFAIINRLLNSPAYANHLNTIENNITNISLDKMTKEILKCISKDFNTFSPILLPGLFSKFYDKLKKEFNVWGGSFYF